MSKPSDRDVGAESGSDDDSDWLSEERPSTLRNLERKRKMTRRSSGKGRNRSNHRLNSQQRRRTNTSFLQRQEERLRQKGTLPVTCGNKNGVLHKHEFNKGEPCISSGGLWFTPSQFEKFGGKMKYKKWKMSICHMQTPLQELIRDGILSSPLFKARRSQVNEVKESECRKERNNPRRTRSGSVPQGDASGTASSSDSSLESNRSAVDNNGDDSDDDDDDDDGGGNDIDDVDNDEDDDDVDHEGSDEDEDDVQAAEREFTGDTFKVTCSGGKGVLHVHRFATETCGKCIRTRDAWLTPKEFLDMNSPGGNWRRDISIRGFALGVLIMRRVLTPHSVNCKCLVCTGSPLYVLDQNNDDVCFECCCDGDLVCCNKCPRAFHHHCHRPALTDETISEHWTCSLCKENVGVC